VSKKTGYDVSEPDVVTRAFSVRCLKTAPPLVSAVLADLEAARREGTVPLVVAGDVVCLYLEDFLADGR